jgi:flagellar hook-associated protein 2
MTAFGTITSQGVGSSLDVAGIVSKLMDIERAPLNRLDSKKASYEAKISAMGSLKSALSTLQTAVSSLRYGTSFQATTVSSSDTSIIQASGSSGAATGSYSLTVSQLAQSQKLVATGQADTTTAIGGGTSTTLTIDLGTISGGTFNSGTGTYSGATFTSNGSGPYTVTIDSTNNSLGGLRDAINAANIGVTATIVNDGDPTNPYRLVLSSTNTGADQSIKIGVSGDATLSTLLSEDPAGTQNLSQTVAAQDALFTVDGISATKSSNTVTDVIQGVTLQLNNVTSGTPVTVSASQDTASVKDAINAFVSGYNDLVQQIKSLTDSGVTSGKTGALASDGITRDIQSSILNEINTAVTSISGSYTTLSSIGVAIQQDGTLAVDDAQLTTALQTDSTNVEQLFTATDGYGTRIGNLLTDMLAANGTIDSRTTSYTDYVKSLDDQSVTLQGRLDRTEQRLRAQFTALDVSISQMSITSNYLTQQLSALNSQSG